MRTEELISNAVVPGMTHAWAPTEPTQPLTKFQQRVRTHAMDSGQLLPYMTAREIKSRYQPGDREVHVEEWETQRPKHGRTQGYGGEGQTTGGVTKYARPYRGEGVLTDTAFMYRETPESEPEFWQRKYRQADMTAREKHAEGRVRRVPPNVTPDYVNERGVGYVEHWKPGQPGGDERLTNLLNRHGVTQRMGPISLTQQRGDLGRPLIAGGHHRIAGMGVLHPDVLMPTSHFPTRAAAMKAPEYT